ncbi:MAG: HAD hydrolase-like protein, partial [Nitrospirota bacterium]
MSVKAIMFDLDGTLVDTGEDITNALNYAIEPYGFKKLTVKDTVRVIGEGVTRLIEKVCCTRPELRDPVIAKFIDYYSA